ncbi:hypothetical protein KC926_01475 [Candidatus Kaiserbacteria bacterium]|nr:hypothetical protein [Candidatus Kaiserbacteria bacterium]
MANDSSLGGASNGNFDLDSQAGVAHLLASVRASSISAEQKNELRDLIFSYANGGKDQSVRITLEQKIASYNVVPVASLVTKKAAPKQVLDFGTSRPSPTFPSSFSKTQVPVKEVAPIAKPPVPPTPAAPVVQPPVVSVPAPQSAPAEVLNNVPPVQPSQTPTAPQAAAPIAAPVAAPAPQPAEPQIPTPAEVVPQPAQASQPAPQPVQAAEPAAEQYDASAALQRIREIKSLVNDKVGNPVNLVDIDNEVGREYMGALLDAMKKLNSGSSAISAMKRLETSYLAVEKTIAAHNGRPKEVVAEAPVVPPKEVKVADVVVEAPVNTEPAVSVKAEVVPSRIPVAPQAPVVPKPIAPEVVQPQQPLNVELTKAPVKPEPVAPLSESPVVPAQTNPQDRFGGSAQTPIQKESPKSDFAWRDAASVKAATDAIKAVEDSEVESAWGNEAPKPPAETPKTPVNTNHVSSLAEALEKPKSINDVPKPSSIETSSVAGDNLFTKEVDEGLEQLLVEWVLFKKSGLFGTGPRGREHPLFKKLSGLQIPLLLAGRFEGATQEIKQSITDYMNGWRYEQGIIYNQGETFEHYLRRVIRHILDLQK